MQPHGISKIVESIESGWSLAARRLLNHLRDPGRLEKDAAGCALRDALGVATVYEAVRLSAERSVANSDPRFATIISRCDVDGEMMKVVADEMHMSLRHLFRFRATIFDALGTEVERIITSRDVVSRDPARAQAQRLVASAEFLVARMAPGDEIRAIDIAEQALRFDPSSAGAWCAIASANIGLALTATTDSALCCSRAAAALDRAEELMPRSGSVYGLRSALSWVLHDRRLAMSLAQEAVATPVASARGHHTLSWLAASSGSFDEAERHSAAAVIAAPTVSVYRGFEMAIMHLRGDYARCVERCRELLDMGYPSTGYVLGYYSEALNALGRYAETIAVVNSVPLACRDFSVQAALARAHALLGDRETALTMARDFSGPAVGAAAIAISLGDEERVWAELERARGARNGMLDLVAFDPVFEPVTGDRRFRSLVA